MVNDFIIEETAEETKKRLMKKYKGNKNGGPSKVPAMESNVSKNFPD